MNTHRSPRAARGRRWPYVVLAALAVLAAASAAIWFARAAIAEWLARGWCAQRDLACTLSVEELRLSRLAVRDLTMTAPEGRPLSLARAEIDLAWSGPLTPILEAVRLDRPVVRASHDGETFSLLGLERVLPQAGSPGDGPRLPPIEAEGGRLVLSTPAGELVGRFDLQLAGAMQGEMQIELAPVRLATSDGHLELAHGRADILLAGGQSTGMLEFDLTSAAYGGFVSDALSLSAAIEPAGEALMDRVSARFRLAARDIRQNGRGVTALVSSGEVEIDTRSVEAADWMAAPRSLTAEFAADRADLPGLVVDGPQIDIALDTPEPDGDLTGPLAVSVRGVSFGDRLSAAEAHLTGEISVSPPGAMTLRGALTASQTALGQALRGQVKRTSRLRAPLSAHGEALGEALDRGLEDFKTGLDFTFDWQADAPGETSSWRLTSRRAARLSAASGLRLSVTPYSAAPWLEAAPDGVSLRGRLALDGGGAPEVDVQLDALSLDEGGFALRLGPSRLAPWRAEGLTLAADLDRLDAAQDSQRTRLTGAGEILLDGDTGPVAFTELRLFGAVDAAREDGRWRAQMDERPCLGLTVEAVSAQSIRFGAAQMSLCPPEGRLVRETGEHLQGTLRIGDVGLPWATAHQTGRLDLSASRIDWQTAGGLTANLSGDRLGLDMKTGERTLEITGARPRLRLDLSGDAPISLEGSLSDLILDGTLVPAQVGIAGASFSARDTSAGLAGEARLQTVRVADRRADPIFQPMTADIEARLREGRLAASGPVFLERGGAELGLADLVLEFPALTGQVTLDSHPLVFRPGGLQLHDLSERLRGYFTDSRGRIEARATITIEGGALSGSGRAEVRDFGFQTLALGRVSGVNGRVIFDDLLALETPAGQEVTIARIEPGVPLEDGRVSFHLTGGGDAVLESAVWPFAGGRLLVEPSAWPLDARERTLTVRADAIELEALTRLLQLPGFEAEGTVSGRFPIEFSGGDVFIREARLAADATGGRLSYTGTAGTRAGETSDAAAMAFNALENFRFTVLEVGADGNLGDDVVLSARLAGHNPDVLDGAPFNFNITIDSKLGQLLSSTRTLTGTDWLAEISAQRRRASEDTPE